MTEKYTLKFVRLGRLLATLKGSIEEYWNSIYDLFSVSDVLIIQSVNGRSVTERRIKNAIALMVENMSEDGYPLIWRVHDGSLFMAIDHKAAPFGLIAYEQYKSLLSPEVLNTIFGKDIINRMEKRIKKRKTIRKQDRYKNFDFYGILSKDVMQGKRPIYLRPRLESMLEDVKKLTDLGSEHARWLRDCIIALEPVIRRDPFIRDVDLEELIDTLYDELTLEINHSTSIGDLETFIRSPAIREWLTYIEEMQRARQQVAYVKKTAEGLKVRTYAPTAEDIVMALKATQPASDPFLEWRKRSIIKLGEEPRLRDKPIIRQLIEYQFTILEDFTEECIWCGKKGIEPEHLAQCSRRSELLGKRHWFDLI